MTTNISDRRSHTSIKISQIDELLERVLADVGPDRFSRMKLLELERFVRAYDSKQELPARTVLRRAINSFRAARWPGTAPKCRS